MGHPVKFKPKNGNKRWSDERRNNHFVYNKPRKNKKQYNKEVVARENLADKQRKEVFINAELKFLPKNPLQPLLLEHLYVDGEYVDHMWVKISVADRRKLKFWHESYRVLMTGTVTLYEKTNDRDVKQKYGLIDVRLKTK